MVEPYVFDHRNPAKPTTPEIRAGREVGAGLAAPRGAMACARNRSKMSAAWVRSSTSVPDPQSGHYCGVTVGAEPDFLRWAEHGDLVAEGPDEGVTPDETDELLTLPVG